MKPYPFNTLFQDMQLKQRGWTWATIEKAKVTHRKQFLDKAGEEKIWKAATSKVTSLCCKWEIVPAIAALKLLTYYKLDTLLCAQSWDTVTDHPNNSLVIKTTGGNGSLTEHLTQAPQPQSNQVSVHASHVAQNSIKGLFSQGYHLSVFLSFRLFRVRGCRVHQCS